MIEEAVFARLTTWPALAALVGVGVYPSRAPQNTPPPYIVYQRIGGPRLRSLGGSSGQANPRMQIDAYAASYAGAKAVAAQIRAALDNYRGDVRLPDGSTVTITGCSLETDRDLLDQTADPTLNRVLHEFTIWHVE